MVKSMLFFCAKELETNTTLRPSIALWETLALVPRVFPRYISITVKFVHFSYANSSQPHTVSLAGRANLTLTPNLWRISQLLACIVNPYSWEVVKFLSNYVFRRKVKNYRSQLKRKFYSGGENKPHLARKKSHKSYCKCHRNVRWEFFWKMVSFTRSKS